MRPFDIELADDGIEALLLPAVGALGSFPV
jgi:hypothetical protein